jgi:hypothetical protein
MSHYIPRHGRSGVATMGVELREALPFLVSVLLGILTIKVFGSLMVGLLLPAATWLLTKQWLAFTRNQAPGFMQSVLYGLGLPGCGYSRALDVQKKRFVGDNQASCPGLLDTIEEARNGSRQPR